MSRERWLIKVNGCFTLSDLAVLIQVFLVVQIQFRINHHEDHNNQLLLADKYLHPTSFISKIYAASIVLPRPKRGLKSGEKIERCTKTSLYSKIYEY